MADESHLSLLKQGANAWNEWRHAHRRDKADLSEADLHGANLSKANLSEADLYSSADKPFAVRLYDALQAKGILCSLGTVTNGGT